MAIGTGDLIEVVLNMRWQAQETLNVYQYEVGNAPPLATAVHYAEAWWNHVKASYRALQLASQPETFISVRLREMNDPAGDYGEFDVPVGEKLGTRANPTQTEMLPPFTSAGVRLVVGTRLTRPGQKRYPFLVESDNSAGILQAAYRALLVTLLNTITVEFTLGAPAALATLRPVVTKKDAAGFVTAFQPITGYVINGNVTTQNSRKFGRGS